MTRRSSSSCRTTLGAFCGPGGSPTLHASIHGSDHTAGTPPATSAASCRSADGSRPGASAISTSPSSSTSTSPAAHSRIACCAAVSPCACVRATSTTCATRLTGGGQRPAVIGGARAGEQLLERRLPRSPVRSKPPHRRRLLISQRASRQPIPRLGHDHSALPPGHSEPSPRTRQPTAIGPLRRRLSILVIDVNQCH